jgi:tetratricopeptide (TPR) repeat protein
VTANRPLHVAMWLEVLRAVLYGMVVLLLAVVAFLAGHVVAAKTAKQPVVLPEAAAAPEKRRMARDFVEAALASRFAGRFREALGYLEQARTEDPALRGLDYQFALTHLELGNFDAAETAARRSVEKDEEKGGAQALTGLIALERARAGGAVEAAREEVLRAVQKSRDWDPLSPMPHYVEAEFHRAAGRPEPAVDAYRRALERVSKTDSIIISTVKAGLAGIRLNHEAGSPPLKLQAINGIYPPEQLFFGAADALLHGDRETAGKYLAEVRGRLPASLFDALLQDSFFQDFLPHGIIPDPSEDAPQP